VLLFILNLQINGSKPASALKPEGRFSGSLGEERRCQRKGGTRGFFVGGDYPSRAAAKFRERPLISEYKKSGKEAKRERKEISLEGKRQSKGNLNNRGSYPPELH